MCLSLLIFISLFSCSFSRFFPSLFFPRKNQNFLWSIFWRRNYVFIFWTPPVICVKSRVFLLLASSFFPCLFHVFCCCDSSSWLFLIIVTFLDFLLSIFCFWASLKNLFVFQDKRSKISFFFLFSFWKNPCYSFSWKSVFCNTFVFSCVISKTYYHFCVFNLFFVKLFCISLFLSKRKMIDSLYFFSSFFFFFFLIRSLFMCPLVMFTLLVVTLPTDKNLVKNLCFTILLRTIFPKKWQNIVSSFRKDLPFLLFSILPFKKSIFCKQTNMFYQFFRFVSLSFKNYPSKKTLTEGRFGIQSGKSM